MFRFTISRFDFRKFNMSFLILSGACHNPDISFILYVIRKRKIINEYIYTCTYYLLYRHLLLVPYKVRQVCLFMIVNVRFQIQAKGFALARHEVV